MVRRMTPAEPFVPRTYAFADHWEAVADRVPDRECLVIFGRDDVGTGRRTFAEMEERANRAANALTAAGVGPGDTVGLYLENRPEYMELMLAAYKIRAVPITVNFRYVANELRYLLDDCGASTVVYEPHFADTFAEVRDDLPAVTTAVEMGPDYEALLAGASPDRPAVERSNDDHYVIYTGGTTGLPKGVVWRQEDAFFACLGGGDPMRMQGPITTPAEGVERIMDGAATSMLLAPFMHAAGAWVSLSWMFAGSRPVLPRGPLDPEQVWQVVADEGANLMTVVGDAVGKPLMDAFEANPGRWDVSALFSISNGGAPMSATLKRRINELFPAIVVNDGFGSSEAGVQGTSRETPSGGTTNFQVSDASRTVVLDDDNQPIAPGTDAVGRVAQRGRLPLGYLNDPEKTAKTFVELDGVRWLITGDLARGGADGSMDLLGRDSATINTGGEKVFAEEVESVLRGLDGIVDVTVVGVPDERWGKAVTAVVQAAPGATVTLDDVVAHCRGELAGYKIPKHVVTVERIQRSPAGKADLRWAVATAEAEVG